MYGLRFACKRYIDVEVHRRRRVRRWAFVGLGVGRLRVGSGNRRATANRVANCNKIYIYVSWRWDKRLMTDFEAPDVVRDVPELGQFGIIYI